jgi:ABC-type nitrate/sulfonate/bicarbonate transport system permease component
MENSIGFLIGQILGVILILLPPCWKIYSKAGFSPWWSLSMFIPPFGLVGIVFTALFLGFRKWPKKEEL